MVILRAMYVKIEIFKGLYPGMLLKRELKKRSIKDFIGHQ